MKNDTGKGNIGDAAPNVLSGDDTAAATITTVNDDDDVIQNSNNIETVTTADHNIKNGIQFSKYYIQEQCIFYRYCSTTTTTTESSCCVAFVNLRPIVPGHVLVIPKRCVSQLYLLSLQEYTDLWYTVRVVQKILQYQYQDGSTKQPLSFNIAVQDGKGAGQSVDHVHVHILPRRPNDFVNNDDIYTELELWDPKAISTTRTNDSDVIASNNKRSSNNKINTLHVPTERKDRTMIEMIAEAEMYRNIVVQNQL